MNKIIYENENHGGETPVCNYRTNFYGLRSNLSCKIILFPSIYKSNWINNGFKVDTATCIKIISKDPNLEDVNNFWSLLFSSVFH